MDRSQLVVVALPAENDPVRKFSSEVEPHLTLLYLGENKYDTAELDRITQYVAFASTLLQPFMMDVESRGELGDKSADVLFFNKEWSKQIVRFRDNLLRNDLVMSAYLSAEQYPGWIPHLTMGYPETPAKKDTRDKPGFWYVNFDRIALWTGESAGPTFPLKTSPYDTEVAMSEAKQGRYPSGDILTHFGVKGMKWGVRRDNGHQGEQVSAKKMAKLDKKFERNANFSTIVKAHNRAAELSNDHDVDRINNKAQYKNADFTNDSPLRRKYYDEHQKAYEKNLEKASDELGTNASGTKKYSVKSDPDTGGWTISIDDVKHADDFENDAFKVEIEYDSTGHIVKIKVPEDSAAQSDKFGGDVLAHFGVKGMRWGVRRSRSELAAAHPDSANAKATVSKLKAGGIKTLSNQELKDLNERLNLEKNYKNLVKEKKTKGEKAVEEILMNVGKQEASKILGKYASKGIANLGL